MRKFYLIDANIAAAYYLKRAAKSQEVATRIDRIVDFIRFNPKEHFIYIPNICIAETVSVFIKHTFGDWNDQLKGRKPIDSRVYRKIIKAFHSDIHNGKFMLHYELDRYHVLGINLVAPIDHWYQIDRRRKNKKKRINPASTFDHLIISMGISLAHIHGHENVVILTTDSRLAKIVRKCRSNIKPQTLKRLKIEIAEEVCSRKFNASLFPACINLGTCSERDLAGLFGTWPVEVDSAELDVPFKYAH